MEKKLIKYCFGFSEKREFDENRGVIMFFAVLDVIGLIILCFGRYFPKIRDWIPENYWIVGFFMEMLFIPALITNAWPFFKYQKAVRKKKEEYEKAPEFAGQVADFAAAQSVNKDYVRIGQQYVFGREGNGPVRIQYIKEIWVECFMSITLWGQMADGQTYRIADIPNKECWTQFYHQCFEEAKQAIIARNPGVIDGGIKRKDFMTGEWVSR